MFVVVLFSLMALLLTFLESKGLLKHGMKLGFLLVTILGAIHYDYGNDYMPYYGIYKDVVSYSFDFRGILEGDYYHEPGWALLCWLFKPIGGFFMLVAVLNIVQNVFVYNFIKNNVECSWWPMSVFIYLFNTGFFLMSFSMMRQFFVIAVFLGIWSLIKKRKWWIVMIVLYLCSYVHSSSVFLLPFAFWGFVPVNKGKIITFCYVSILLALWFFHNVLNGLFIYVLSFDDVFSDYADTYEKDGNNVFSVGIGFFINMIPFVLSVLYVLSKGQSSAPLRQLVALNAIAFLVTPFAQIIQLMGRLGAYFNIYSLGAMPLVYANVRRVYMRNCLLLLYVLIMLYDYFMFFQSEIWAKKYATFHTIFSQIFLP